MKFFPIAKETTTPINKEKISEDKNKNDTEADLEVKRELRRERRRRTREFKKRQKEEEKRVAIQRSQSFTSLMADLRQESRYKPGADRTGKVRGTSSPNVPYF